MKKRILKSITSLILIIILSLNFTTMVYGNELSDMYTILFKEYSLSGTVINKDLSGILIDLDTPISTSLSVLKVEYAYIKGSWNVSIGDSFKSSIKFQMFDIMNQNYNIIGIFEQSIGTPNITVPEEYISDEDTKAMLDWIIAATPTKPYSPNTETVIYYGIYAIDEEGVLDEGMDLSLLRLYVDNPGYMYIAAEPPVYNEYYDTWTYNPVLKNIKDFKNGKTIVKNNTYYFPMREVLEYYGHTVNWTPKYGTTISDYIIITPNSKTVKNIRDNTEVIMDNNIELINGITYVPIEFLQKAFPENGFKWISQDRGHGCISIDITQEIAG